MQEAIAWICAIYVSTVIFIIILNILIDRLL